MKDALWSLHSLGRSLDATAGLAGRALAGPGRSSRLQPPHGCRSAMSTSRSGRTCPGKDTRRRRGHGFFAVLAVLAIVLGGPRTATATPVAYDFTYTGTTVGFHLGDPGDLTGVFEVDGGFIVAMTGTDGIYGAITSLLSPDSYLGNDNVLNTSAPFLTGGGVSFAVAGISLNLFFSTSGGTYHLQDSGPTLASTGSLVVTPEAGVRVVPEPESLALFSAAVLAFGVSRRMGPGRKAQNAR
jgi:hypothetical protein